MNKPILECINLCKSYKDLIILNNINMQIFPGQTVSITGSSGSGKSTLIHILAGLDSPTNGEIILDNRLLNNLSDKESCVLRNKSLGFIYQFHHLLPEFNALENVLIPISINRQIKKEDKNFAIELFNKLNLIQRLSHFPSELSGGERQRVAIVRALINNPKIVFADEPTGNLDNTTANQVLDIFFELQKALQTTLILVTHDMEIAKKTDVSYYLHQKQLVKK